jgi:hypothetical protein
MEPDACSEAQEGSRRHPYWATARTTGSSGRLSCPRNIQARPSHRHRLRQQNRLGPVGGLECHGLFDLIEPEHTARACPIQALSADEGAKLTMLTPITSETRQDSSFDATQPQVLKSDAPPLQLALATAEC